MKDTLTLPEVSPRRYWEVKHQPTKKTTPLRLELREHIRPDGTQHVPSWTRLIGYEDTIALPSSIVEAAAKILERASRVDEFVGMHNNVRITS